MGAGGLGSCLEDLLLTTTVSESKWFAGRGLGMGLMLSVPLLLPCCEIIISRSTSMSIGLVVVVVFA